MSDQSPLNPVAVNLSRRRQQRGVSVSALAKAAGISKSTLSQLERGVGNPSIDTLWALARALSVPLGALFEERHTDEFNVRRFADTNPMPGEQEGFDVRLLLRKYSKGEWELYLIDIGERVLRSAPAHGRGLVEHVIVISGRVEIAVDGQAVIASPGDCISFPADRPHSYASVDGPARIFSIHDYD